MIDREKVDKIYVTYRTNFISRPTFCNIELIFIEFYSIIKYILIRKEDMRDISSFVI